MIIIHISDKEIKIHGHAEYDDKGKDIVCASVSTIFQLAKMGLLQLSQQYPENIKIIRGELNE
ncbi:MAG: ribosomal-processing cysteine protease Prp [Erysipelotrichia bacterium]|nr:ribosomal-processing cysteine protease Prp [Erysipelotrichia bacterium]